MVRWWYEIPFAGLALNDPGFRSRIWNQTNWWYWKKINWFTKNLNLRGIRSHLTQNNR